MSKERHKEIQEEIKGYCFTIVAKFVLTKGYTVYGLKRITLLFNTPNYFE